MAKPSKKYKLRLISIIRKYPYLYDKSLSEHGKKILMDKAWKNVARQLNDDVENCKICWDLLLEDYATFVLGRGDENLARKFPWHRLNFLRALLLNSRLKIASSKDEVDGDEWQDMPEETDMTDVDGCLMSYLKEKKRQIENPKRQFLLSLLPDLEDMNDDQIRLFRRKVSALISDILRDRPRSVKCLRTRIYFSH